MRQQKGPVILSLDIGSNSVGSGWIDSDNQKLNAGVSVFPAGVDESDEKRGDPKNAKRRSTRRTRITLARRAHRKRRLRQKLISVGLLPADPAEFRRLLEETDPWQFRREGLSRALEPHQFGRLLLHLAQRRGALGFDVEVGDKGKVKSAITKTHLEMLVRFGSAEAKVDSQRIQTLMETLNKKKSRTEQEGDELEQAQENLKQHCHRLLEDPSVTFGRLIADLRDEWRTQITTPDQRKEKVGPREWRQPVRNRAGEFRYHADRAMIRDEFSKLWEMQKRQGGVLAKILTDELRLDLDNEQGDSLWRHKGLLFGQRKQSWDLGTLGRCVLEPSERCAPHADMYASRYLVVETVNNLKIIERGRDARPLTTPERNKIKTYLSGPLGVQTKGKSKGQPKRSVTVSDLRDLMDWGHATKTSQFRFNIESDEDRQINTDWFRREIIHGAVGINSWTAKPERVRHGINHAILKFDPDEEKHAAKLKAGLMEWAALSEAQADALVAAWKKRPRPDAKRLNMSRRAVRNILTVMDRDEPWTDTNSNGQPQWLTQIAARKMIAKMDDFLDASTRKPLDCHARRRYATGSKGATKRDRHYLRKHVLKKNGEPIIDPDGKPLSEPPPAPLISNPVVRKAIHEVRRHLIEYMITFERKPDEVRIELSREARMGKKDADELLFKNRLRSRIKNDILVSFKLDSVSSTQQRAAFERVVLAIQQEHVCPLCGQGGLTANLAARGSGCEIAHILPRGGGGDNGWKNIVLAHDECNRKMGRRTPRQFWEETVPGGFDEGISWIEKMYTNMERPKPSEIKTASGNSLWSCYFTNRDYKAKLEQFKKNITDIQGMTVRQDAATKYATRQVMAYLADALFDGNGLPERGGERRIFATDGMWTARLRREWGLFFDPHHFKAKGLTNQAEHERKEKNRGDHRHHAIDAIVIGLTTDSIQEAWKQRELQADKEGVNTADEQQMENYRRLHPLPPPKPYKTREEFREAVRRAVFGDDQLERPVCHRPVKRKLIGALHEETLFGPVVDRQGKLTENYSAKKSVLQLDPNHLRLPRDEMPAEAVERLAQRYLNQKLDADIRQARKRAKAIVQSKTYTPRKIDPSPGKSGFVRDLALRKRIRECLSEFSYAKKNKSGETIGEPARINPDDFTQNEIKQAYEAGAICHKSGIPIRSVVLLRTMSDPVVISRWATEHPSGKQFKVYDGLTGKGDAAAARAYVGGNNHHIEIRVSTNKKGLEVWSGQIVTTFEATQRKLARLRAMRVAEIPKLAALRKLSKQDREKFKPALREIEKAYPIVDRSNNDEKGGKFIISICEGEMLLMRHKKRPDEVGYFVVAKLEKPQSIVLVPHWDARSATERKDAEGKKVPDSQREQFTVTPSDLKELAPPEHLHAIKIQVSPLGKIRWAND